MILEIKFEGYNWWGDAVYRTKKGTPIVKLEPYGYFTLSEPNDIDSEPYRKLKSDLLKIVTEFSN